MADNKAPKRGSARRWISRKEAAAILTTSYENVKRLQRVGALESRMVGPMHLFDRLEVEELARKRARSRFNSPSGELTARVFRMFREGRSLADVVIETDRSGDDILRLWEQYSLSLRLAASPLDDADEAERARVEHEEQIREMERELERRRRLLHAEDEKPSASPASTGRGS